MSRHSSMTSSTLNCLQIENRVVISLLSVRSCYILKYLVDESIDISYRSLTEGILSRGNLLGLSVGDLIITELIR